MCSGKGLPYAEVFRDTPHIRPLCLLIKREVTWEGEVLNVPPDISERARAAYDANPDRWVELFEASVAERGQEMATYVKRLDTDEVLKPYDPDGYNVSLASEWRGMLMPFRARGLTIDEAATHFYRMHSRGTAEDITDQVIWEQAQRSFEE